MLINTRNEINYLKVLDLDEASASEFERRQDDFVWRGEHSVTFKLSLNYSSAFVGLFQMNKLLQRYKRPPSSADGVKAVFAQ